MWHLTPTFARPQEAFSRLFSEASETDNVRRRGSAKGADDLEEAHERIEIDLEEPVTTNFFRTIHVLAPRISEPDETRAARLTAREDGVRVIGVEARVAILPRAMRRPRPGDDRKPRVERFRHLAPDALRFGSVRVEEEVTRRAAEQELEHVMRATPEADPLVAPLEA